MEMLRSEINTSSMQEQIERAARKALLLRDEVLETLFERGQWWVRNVNTGELWAVEDAEGIGTVDGFDFEKVRGYFRNKGGNPVRLTQQMLDSEFEYFSIDSTCLLRSPELRLDAGFYNTRLRRTLEALRQSGMKPEKLGRISKGIFYPSTILQKAAFDFE